MKILRDETGQVILGLATDAQTAATSSDSQPAASFQEEPRAVPAARTARPTPHCCFHCRYCDAVISLPHDRLGLAFAAPVLRRTNVRSVGAVCDSCHHVAGYSLFRGAHGYDTRHKLAAVQPAGDTTLVDMLRCDEETCTHPLPLFVTAEGALTGDTVKELGKGWDWDELTCAQGHRIRRPMWLYDRKALVFPPPLK